MDFSDIMNQLEDASLFDLYRLNAAIDKEMENPERIEKVKRMIKPGDKIQYFLSEENRLVEADVLEIKRTRLLVRNKHDMKRWDIPFYMVNLENISVDILPDSTDEGMSRHEIRVGDLVGFRDKANNKLRGKVLRLNQKTVTIFVEPNQKWRVAYRFLHPIVDGQKANEQKFLEGIVVKRDTDESG